MYSSTKFAIKKNGLISQLKEFDSGVKRGDGLSPLLFNIFINDLPQIFSGENDSPLLRNTAISCLTYADDLF